MTAFRETYIIIVVVVVVKKVERRVRTEGSNGALAAATAKAGSFTQGDRADVRFWWGKIQILRRRIKQIEIDVE